MQIHKVLEMDCRGSQEMDAIQILLRKIKPLAKAPEDKWVPMYLVERCAQVLCRKYDFELSISMDPVSNVSSPIWRLSVRRKGKQVESGANVWGTSLYEVMAKGTILMYDITRREKHAS